MLCCYDDNKSAYILIYLTYFRNLVIYEGIEITRYDCTCIDYHLDKSYEFKRKALCASSFTNMSGKSLSALFNSLFLL